MRKIAFLASLLLANAAHAEWIPHITSTNYIVTVNYGGGSLVYSEDRKAEGPLDKIALEMLSVPHTLESSLNGVLSPLVTQNGARFLSGKLSGNPSITLRPDASGVTMMNVNGLSYQTRNMYSGTKWGVINFECVNTLSLNDIAITAQYGTVNGNMPAENVGMTANTYSSTDCDSNLSWILPVVGNLLIKNAQGKIDAKIQEGVQGGLAKIKDQLFFERDANWRVGLTRLIAADKKVRLPDGSEFPLGQYVQDNLAYLLANSQMSITVGRGAKITEDNQPHLFTGDLVTIALSSPAISFSVNLSEKKLVRWEFKCLRPGTPSCRLPD